MELPKKALTIQQIFQAVAIFGVVVVGAAIIVLPQVLNNNKNLSLLRTKASEAPVDMCSVDITIPTPTTIPPTLTFSPPTLTLSPPTLTPTIVSPTLTPTPTITPIICQNNTDIALIIDRSSSMNEPDGITGSTQTKLYRAKEAAKTLVNNIIAGGRTNIRISVTSFGAQGNDDTGTLLPRSDYNSTKHIDPTNVYSAVLTAIDSVNYKQWGTCGYCGLRIGDNTLLSPETTNAKYVIFISDGIIYKKWDGTDGGAYALAYAEADAGRTKGITYYTIGYGAGSNVDQTALRRIAGNIATNYSYRPNVADWSKTFLDILAKICNN